MKKIAARRSSSKKSASGKTKTKGKAQTKTRYRVKNWSAYNRALIARGRISLWLSQEALTAGRYAGPPQRGAQVYYSALAIETSLSLHTLFDLNLRRTPGVVQSLLERLHPELKAPD